MTKQVPAWGSIRRTRHDAIDSATANLRRHAAETGRVVTGAHDVEEVRKTPTGYQARVAGNMRPNRRNRRND
jgi:hypothetical protein